MFSGSREVERGKPLSKALSHGNLNRNVAAHGYVAAPTISQMSPFLDSALTVK
jgi:hypothetical protein